MLVKKILAATAPLLATACSLDVNIDVHDRRYPKPNPTPNHFVELRVIVPTGLQVRLESFYRAAEPASGGSDNCQVTVGWGATSPTRIYVPIEFPHTGILQTVKLAVDQFKPGVCKWAFAGLTYRVLSGTSKDNRELSMDEASLERDFVALYTEDVNMMWPGFTPIPSKDHSYQGPVDISCRVKWPGSTSGDPPDCRKLLHPKASNRATTVANTDTTMIFSDTKVVEIQFSVNGDAITP